MAKRIDGKKNLLLLVLMIIISLVTQILSIMKSSLLAGFFGTSTEIDAYNFANSITAFIFGFVSAGISTIVIPLYVKEKNNKELNPFLTIVYGILLIITILIIAFRVPLMKVLTNRDSIFISVAAQSLVILMLSNFLTSFSYITAAFFQCIDRYNTPKIINMLSQLVVIIILLTRNNITIYEYAAIISIGVVINFSADTICALIFGWRIKLDFHFSSESTKNLVDMFWPIVLSTGIYRISLLVDSTIASRLDVGKITILSYSNQIATMVNSLIVGNLLIYVYPRIVKRIQLPGSQQYFWKQSFFFHSVVCLVIAGFVSIGNEGISLLFEHGEFDSSSAKSVFIGALIYIFGQQINIIRDLIYRYFYAKGNTKAAAANSIIVGITNIVVSLILVYFIGLYGIIIGTVIASFTSLVTIMLKFKRIIGFEMNILGIIKEYIVNIIICVVSSAFVILTKKLIVINSSLIGIMLFGIEIVSVYLLLTFIFNRKVIDAARSI